MGKDRPKLEGDALLDAVQQALESLLDRDNVATNATISSAMDQQTYVPVAVLVKTGEIKKLTRDKSVLIQAAGKSEQLSVNADETMIKPNYKARRNIVIVRDAPEGASEDDVKAVFVAPHDANLESVLKEHNNTFFVSFTSDETAQEAALWARLNKVKVGGADVSIAIKSDHLKKSYIAAEEAQNVHMHDMMAHMQYMMLAQAAAAYHHKGKGKGYGQYPPGPPAKAAAKHRKRTSTDKSLDDVEAPGENEPGPIRYSHEFRKYSRQQLIDLCSTLTDVPLAEGFEEAKEVGVVVAGEADRTWIELPEPEQTHEVPEAEKPSSKPEGKGASRRGKGKGRGKGSTTDPRTKAAGHQPRASGRGYGSGPVWVVKKPA